MLTKYNIVDKKLSQNAEFYTLTHQIVHVHPHELHQQNKDRDKESSQKQPKEIPEQVYVYFLNYSQFVCLSSTCFPVILSFQVLAHEGQREQIGCGLEHQYLVLAVQQHFHIAVIAVFGLQHHLAARSARSPRLCGKCPSV